jgi:hypothetical protein
MRIELDALGLKTGLAIAYPTCDGDPHRPDPDLARWLSNDRRLPLLSVRPRMVTVASIAPDAGSPLRDKDGVLVPRRAEGVTCIATARANCWPDR